MKQLTPSKIAVTCTDKLTEHTGKRITSFDLVQSWTDFIKDNPAEGAALFLHVKGLKKFIRGEEGVIAGFSVSNEQVITINLSQPDIFAIQRLYSPKLLPPSLKNGRMYLKKKQDNSYNIARNPHYPYARSFLDECTIICGNDKNPIVSYSLNKYDMLFLYKKNDIAYARQALSKNSGLSHIATDRYFVSLASESLPLRKYISDLIQPLEIQTNTIKAEGEVITGIESPASKPAAEKKTVTASHNVSTPVTIVYNTGDPASITIAEKIFSDLSHAGIPCKLNGLDKCFFEAALLDRTYDIAVGWVSDKIISSTNEKLRLATLWFNNVTDEAVRINEYYEKPLFTIHRYALYKKDIRFYKNQVSGMYRTTTE
jgi:MarR-like DNA-binding transcriptional regulator SgrR of sgrS sRNA